MNTSPLKTKKRITRNAQIKSLALVLSLCFIISSLTGCGRKEYAEPDLISPIALTKMFRHPEMRDMKDVKFCEGIVVPKDYPAFYKNTTVLTKINVKVGDYVEAGDVLAVGDVQSNGRSVDDWNSMISYESQMKDIQGKITDCEIEIENYTRTAAEEDGDADAVAASDEKLALLNEDKRYNSAVSDYKISSYAESRDELLEEAGEATLVAEHSGYVTFIKDISSEDTARAYENVVVISDMDDLYIECQDITVKLYKCSDYDEKYTYINGEKVNVSEIDYPEDIKSLSEVTGDSLNVRFKADGDLKAGDNMLIVLKKMMKEDVMTVGAGAVVAEGLNRYVYVRKNGDDIEKRNVETGYSNGSYVEIKYGLSMEDEVYYPLEQFYPANYKLEEVGTADLSETKVSKFILGKNSNITGYYVDFAGTIEEINVKVEDEVKKGDLLFTYSTENTAAKLGEISEKISTLRSNHADTIEMYTEMKENLETTAENEENGTSTTTDTTTTDTSLADGTDAAFDSTAGIDGFSESAGTGNVDTQNQGHTKYSLEKNELNIEIIDYRIEMENILFNMSLSSYQSEYDEISKNNDGNGLISVYAESDGIVRNIDKDAVVGEVYKGRSYILSVAEEGVNQTLIQMREFKTNAFGQSEPETDTGIKSAAIGKEITVTIGDKTTTGRSIGTNGQIKSVYEAYSDGKPVFSFCTPGTEYKDQFYAELDGTIDYDVALSDKGNVEVSFLYKDYKSLPVLDQGLIYSDYINGSERSYVWIEKDDELVKQYITVTNLGMEKSTCYVVIDGIEVGDKVVRETITAVGED